MTNKLLTLLSMLLLTAGVHAQVTLAVQVPPSGVMQKNQLWNLVLVSTSDAPVQARVTLTLLTTTDNTPVMTATARTVTLTKGARQVSASDLAPVQYNYLSPLFNVDRNPNGFLPIGNFMACYTVTKTVGDAVSQLAEECVPVEVQPLSPPMLNTPFDKDTLNTAYPQFTWLPPAPLQLFNDLAYDLVVVAVQAGQSTLQAIAQNIPVYNVGNLREPVNVYPASYKSLDTATTYAWHIIAKNNNQVAAQSEVRTFTLKGNQENETSTSGSYILLRNDNEATGINGVEMDTIGIKHYSFDSDFETSIRFINENGIIIKEKKQLIHYGDNFLLFSLSTEFEKEKVYRIELSDKKGSRYSARFRIKKQD